MAKRRNAPKPGEYKTPQEMRANPTRLLTEDEQFRVAINSLVARGTKTGGIGIADGESISGVLMWAFNARVNAYLLESVLANKMLILIDEEGDVSFSHAPEAEVATIIEAARQHGIKVPYLDAKRLTGPSEKAQEEAIRVLKELAGEDVTSFLENLGKEASEEEETN